MAHDNASFWVNVFADAAMIPEVDLVVTVVSSCPIALKQAFGVECRLTSLPQTPTNAMRTITSCPFTISGTGLSSSLALPGPYSTMEGFSIIGGNERAILLLGWDEFKS